MKYSVILSIRSSDFDCVMRVHGIVLGFIVYSAKPSVLIIELIGYSSMQCRVHLVNCSVLFSKFAFNGFEDMGCSWVEDVVAGVRIAYCMHSSLFMSRFTLIKCRVL